MRMLCGENLLALPFGWGAEILTLGKNPGLVSLEEKCQAYEVLLTKLMFDFCCVCLQGSHVTRWPGFYILQWKFHSMPACATTNLPRVDDVLASLQVSSHKCKVMYYTEVIGSEDFRYVWPRAANVKPYRLFGWSSQWQLHLNTSKLWGPQKVALRELMYKRDN